MNKTFKRVFSQGRHFQLLTLPGTNLFKFEIVNLYGANVEREVERSRGQNVYGLSHFIEHLGFRATKDYPTETLLDLLKTEGTYNASTDYDRINYWFKTTMEHVGIGTRLVCNYALNDLKQIPDEEFQIEKKVVYNEAKRYADDDQVMFQFNSVAAACGYHAEDNVIGVPETIDNFTLEQAIALKETFLANGKQIYNITYDPMVMDEDAVLAAVNAELDRFPHPERTLEHNRIDHDYHEMLRDPKLGHHVLENESEQYMTILFMDNVKHAWTSTMANNYLGRYATNTALDDVIREQNGLTYGVGFYEDIVSYKPYTVFTCDVTRGTEGLLMELLRQSINKSVDAFDQVAYEKLLKTVRLKRTMRNINQESYDTLFWLSIWKPYIIDAADDIFVENVDDAAKELDRKFATYDELRECMETTREMVNNQTWSIITS